MAGVRLSEVYNLAHACTVAVSHAHNNLGIIWAGTFKKEASLLS
jgi:hypothetical protein